MKKLLMPFVIVGVFLCMALAACTTPQVQNPEPTATGVPQVNMPNPASVYCTQHGNKLEIHTAADGSQSGVCVFSDGSTCDEWAYFRGECGSAAQASPTPAPTVAATATPGAGASEGSVPTGNDDAGSFMPPETTEALADWWGVIKSTKPGAQFDDYFERQDLGQKLYFGIDSLDPALKSQIEMVRDSGKIVHLYGTLLSNVPDYNGSQIQVNRIEVEEQASGGYKPPETTEALADWWGVIKSTLPGAQFDDYFERQDLGQKLYFGIDSLDPAVKSQIEMLRDSGKVVHLYGTLVSNVPDYNGSQILVERIEVE